MSSLWSTIPKFIASIWYNFGFLTLLYTVDKLISSVYLRNFKTKRRYGAVPRLEEGLLQRVMVDRSEHLR